VGYLLLDPSKEVIGVVETVEVDGPFGLIEEALVGAS
jgi:hypothetical protein